MKIIVAPWEVCRVESVDGLVARIGSAGWSNYYPRRPGGDAFGDAVFLGNQASIREQRVADIWYRSFVEANELEAAL